MSLRLGMLLLFFPVFTAVPPPAASAGVASFAGIPLARFRAMSPRDLDEETPMVDAKPVLPGPPDRSKMREEVAALFGIDFGPRPQTFVLELRPDSNSSGLLDGAAWVPAVDTDTPNGMPSLAVQNITDEQVTFEFIEELSGDLDELCERFLRNATVKVLSEEEYEERKRAVNYTSASSPRHRTEAESGGSKATMRVVEQAEPPAPSCFFVADHALDAVNASVRDALEKKFKSILPPRSAISMAPKPGDFLVPGPFGLERDWTTPDPFPQDFQVIKGKEGASGKVEVCFSLGGDWDRGDGADVLLQVLSLLALLVHTHKY